MAKKLVSIVIPVLNEEGNLPVLYERLSTVLKNLAADYELLFINDGSSDQSLLLLKTFADRDAHIKIIDFSRNFGHQLAVTAGLDHCHGDCAVIIDADLQDPPELITELITKWNAGYQVVYAQRVKRKGEHFIKVFTARIFYRLLKKLANIEIPLDTPGSDYVRPACNMYVKKDYPGKRNIRCLK